MGAREGALKSRIERMWRLATLLHGARVGRTQAQLVDALETSRATLYRDLRVLEGAGVPIGRDTVNGEVRFRLLSDKLPTLVSPMRRIAVALACDALGALRGTSLHRELERVKNESPSRSTAENVVVVASAPAAKGAVLEAVERALQESKQLVVKYRGTHDDAAKPRTVLPLSLRLVKGQVYLLVRDETREAERTLKLARIEKATLGDSFDPRGFSKPQMTGAVVAWSGQLIEVAIRVKASVARFAEEWPLIATQRLSLEASGDVVVRAEVAGTEEVLRWVLGWGRNAEVLSPPELRQRVKEELREALGGYAEQGVSRKVRQGRAKVVAGEKQRPGAMNGVNRNHGFVARKAI